MSSETRTTRAITARPRPPEDLVSVAGLAAPDRFVPAHDLRTWIEEAYLMEGAPFFTEEHAHLRAAQIGCLWTNCENKLHMRIVHGQAEMPSRSYARWGKWQRARGEQQLMEWFGDVPDFLLTFDALHADECPDANFAALVDHELYHCAQATDAFGDPKFSKVTGLAEFAIRGHDVEEFVGVVRRFGVQAAGEQAVDMVLAAAQPPEITAVALAQACGTCLRLAA